MTQASRRCVLFDLDGVLVDSTAAYRAAWADWAERHGIADATIWADAHGRRPQDIIQRVAPMLPLDEALADFDDALDEHLIAGCEPLPGVRDCLIQLPSSDWAVITSGRHRHVITVLSSCGLPIPPVLICGEETVRGKPDPQCFLLGMERLGASPGVCIGVEDAPAGITAAKRAGAFVIALATTHDVETLTAADEIHLSFADAAPQILRRTRRHPAHRLRRR
jgi:mannitol-1-/sugar-/sorbitol-6-phosphatase